MILGVCVCAVMLVASVASANPVTVWVDDDYNSSTGGWGVTHFDNITDGVAAVTDGGTVNVAAGSYSEHIINQFAPYSKSFDLIGAGADVVTWAAPSNQYPLQLDQHSGVSYEVSGFNFIGDAAHPIKLAGAGFDDLDIHDNVFNDVNASGLNNFGLFMCRITASRTDGVSSVRVHDNVFNTEKGICMSNAESFDIFSNRFNVTVQGIYSGAGCSTGYGVGDHKIYCNTFSGLSGDAVTLDYWADGHPAYLSSAINYNSFESIGGYAINVTTDRGFDENAENNWWGDASGPTHTGNPSGTGEAVTDHVDYDPYLAAPPPCTIPEPMSMIFFGTGLVGVFGFVARRRARNQRLETRD